MPYIHFTEDQKLRANSVDLVEFLRRQGEKLISSGQDKRLTSDHSITVHGNEWYDHAAERGGHGTIITSYFDEGVFGNYGWDEPLGDCGLIAWTSDGTPLWKNEKYSIYDCYAISLDEEENLWFYYYDEFRLVRTNFKEDFVFELPIEGSGAFSVAPSGNTFLFQGGYQQRDKFYFLTAHGDHLGKKQEAIPTCDGNKVAVEQCSLLRSQMLFLGKNGVLYGGILGGDGL